MSPYCVVQVPALLELLTSVGVLVCVMELECHFFDEVRNVLIVDAPH